MISDLALKRLCKPVVLRRAQRIVASGTLISKRTCRFEEGETVLKARVDSSSSWDEAHRTSAVLDESADALVYYECDCRSSLAADSPCDHVAALVMDYNQRPEGFAGYGDKGGPLTSRGIARLIERGAAAQSSLPGATPTDTHPGSVSLEPTLSYEVGFDVRFRVVGPSGTYALKSISEFVFAMESGDVYAYGKRLAFEHKRAMFSLQSQRLAEFVVRAVQNRRAYAFERVTGRGTAVTSASPTRELHLSAPELWELLDICASTGILFDDRTAGAAQPAVRKMRIVRRDPDIRLSIVALESGGFEVERVRGVHLVAAGQHALAWDDATLYCCSERLSKDAALLVPLLGDPSEHMVLSNKDALAFCASVLPRLEESVRLSVTPALDEYRPQPCELRFYVDYQSRDSVVTCDARATYGDVSLPLFAMRAATDAPDSLVRNARVEAAGREVVRRFFEVRDGIAFARAKGERLGALVYEGMAALQEVGTVYAAPAFERLRSSAHPHIRVGLSVRSNLLDLSFGLTGLPVEELAALLESYQQKRVYHRLRDGSFVKMDDADVSVAGKVVEELGLEATQAREVVTLPAYRALLLQGFVEDEDKDESLQSYLDGIHAVDDAAYVVPEPLVGVLRPYQAEGFKWLCRLCDLGLGGILADEMGLGKSLQLISFLLARADDARKTGPSLVVCPSSLVYNWLAEFHKFAPQLNVHVIAGTPQERAEARRQRPADVLITSYDLLRRDVMDYDELRLWCVALDEAQYIKNPATQAARAVKTLHARHRVALTGTPVENRLSELWSIFDFLMPGLLGSYERFRERYERPIVEDEDAQVVERLREAVRPFILRRAKTDVAQDLPDKIEQVVRAHMGTRQRMLYDAQVQEVRNQVAADGDESFGAQKFQVLALLTRLRQICCDPQLLYEDYADGSCKTDTIMTLVERVVDAGEKMLLFSQFTSYLDVLAAELERRGIPFYTIVGSTPSSRRVELVNKFNDDDTPVFLISLKAGGTGLNLTGATVVVHADPWWNLAAQNQATDRAHRIGQTHEVTVYEVIASGTIEERILELQRTKAELADAVVQGDVSSLSLSSLTAEDLEALLS